MFGEKKERKLLILRGSFGVVALTCLHFSIKLIDPSDSVSILHTNVVFVAFLARFFLKEKFSFAFLIAMFLTIIGIFFIAQPSFLTRLIAINLPKTDSNSNQTKSETVIDDDDHVSSFGLRRGLGIFIGIFSSLASSIVAILLKKLANHHVHYASSIIYASFFGLPVGLLLSIIFHFTNLNKNQPVEANEQFGLYLLQQAFFSILSASCGILSQMKSYL